jgi:hypothetical protein
MPSNLVSHTLILGFSPAANKVFKSWKFIYFFIR